MNTSASAQRKPSRADLQAAYGRTIPDVIAPSLCALFCGINPSVYSAAVGHHFARPGNRFWKTLHAARITPRLLSPFEDRELLRVGCGLTNLVARATVRADELSDAELRHGRERLAAKLARYRPRALVVLGVSAYRTAFAQPRAALGLQAETLAGSKLWVLPNPSGLNAHYQLPALAALYRAMWQALEEE